MIKVHQTPKPITISINNLNDNNPLISSSDTFSANENQTSIGSVTATDADGDSITYSISGSEINISSSGVLSFASSPDYETKNSYQQRLQSAMELIQPTKILLSILMILR